jgi:hypothetical protein
MRIRRAATGPKRVVMVVSISAWMRVRVRALKGTVQPVERGVTKCRGLLVVGWCLFDLARGVCA